MDAYCYYCNQRKWKIKFTMKTGKLPWKEYSVLFVPIRKYIIGINIPQGMALT